MSSQRLLVVGSANVDLVTRVPRCPKPGETLFGTAFAVVAGGKGANQAMAAARLGAETRFAGCVGNDDFGALQRRTLGEAGIDITHLKTHPTLPTGTAVIFVADDGENAIVVTPGANSDVSPADVEALAPVMAKVNVLLLQLEIPLESIDAALGLARRHGVLSVLDCGPAREAPAEILKKAGIVSPNETEAEAMTGVTINTIEDAHHAAEKLKAMGAAEIVIKLGAKGAFYLGEQGWFHVQAFDIRPVDTTAAGDAFSAALGLTWRRPSHHEALRCANAAGALAATKAGAQPSMPTRAEVEAFLKSKEG